VQVPILVGLGNHDYENNVNDCVGNVCAERMLRWFSQEYVPGMAQWGGGGMMMRNLDLAKRQELWKTIYEGSLAYSSRICTNQSMPEIDLSNLNYSFQPMPQFLPHLLRANFVSIPFNCITGQIMAPPLNIQPGDGTFAALSNG
jgi:hypothetical protein